MPEIVSIDRVTDSLGRHIRLYRWHRPTYQRAMLASLASVWDPSHRRVLDVGGGTGVVAQAVKDLFAVEHVTSVDVEDRFLKTLTVDTATFDGRTLPFGDGAFECVVICNVLHHVTPSVRAALMGECARVSGNGPIYIKDHVTTGSFDSLRLAALDLIGNVPFKGMVRAQYLSAREWKDLADAVGYRIDSEATECYRTGLFAMLFPNRLEITMKWLSRQT
jgi:ubiquinone/menaquinone biosynthesis C-methylase UbiE